MALFLKTIFWPLYGIPVSDHFQITLFCSGLFCVLCIRYTILELHGF